MCMSGTWVLGSARIQPQIIPAHPVATTGNSDVTPVYEATVRGSQLGGLPRRGEYCLAKIGQAK